MTTIDSRLPASVSNSTVHAKAPQLDPSWSGSDALRDTDTTPIVGKSSSAALTWAAVALNGSG